MLMQIVLLHRVCCVSGVLMEESNVLLIAIIAGVVVFVIIVVVIIVVCVVKKKRRPGKGAYQVYDDDDNGQYDDIPADHVSGDPYLNLKRISKNDTPSNAYEGLGAVGGQGVYDKVNDDKNAGGDDYDDIGNFKSII